MTLKAKPEVGTSVTSERILKEISGARAFNKIDAKTIQDALAHLQPGYREIKMDLQLEPVTCPDSGCQTVSLKFSSKTLKYNLMLVINFHALI